MHVLVIVAHPDSGSFNHAITKTAVSQLKQNNHQVILHDLYAEKFDPILHPDEIPTAAPLPTEIARHCEEIANVDGIIIIHPNWWGQPPAILKGWVDRIIRPEVAYRFLEGDNGEGIPEGLLKAKTSIVFNTSNTPTEREMNIFGDPLDRLWKDCIFDFCGVDNFYRKMFNVVITSSFEQRQTWLTNVQEVIGTCFPSVP